MNKAEPTTIYPVSKVPSPAYLFAIEKLGVLTLPSSKEWYELGILMFLFDTKSMIILSEGFNAFSIDDPLSALKKLSNGYFKPTIPDVVFIGERKQSHLRGLSFSISRKVQNAPNVSVGLRRGLC